MAHQSNTGQYPRRSNYNNSHSTDPDKRRPNRHNHTNSDYYRRNSSRPRDHSADRINPSHSQPYAHDNPRNSSYNPPQYTSQRNDSRSYENHSPGKDPYDGRHSTDRKFSGRTRYREEMDDDDHTHRHRDDYKRRRTTDSGAYNTKQQQTPSSRHLPTSRRPYGNREYTSDYPSRDYSRGKDAPDAFPGRSHNRGTSDHARPSWNRDRSSARDKSAYPVQSKDFELDSYSARRRPSVPSTYEQAPTPRHRDDNRRDARDNSSANPYGARGNSRHSLNPLRRDERGGNDRFPPPRHQGTGPRYNYSRQDFGACAVQSKLGEATTEIVLEGPYMFGYARLLDQTWPVQEDPLPEVVEAEMEAPKDKPTEPVVNAEKIGHSGNDNDNVAKELHAPRPVEKSGEGEQNEEYKEIDAQAENYQEEDFQVEQMPGIVSGK